MEEIRNREAGQVSEVIIENSEPQPEEFNGWRAVRDIGIAIAVCVAAYFGVDTATSRGYSLSFSYGETSFDLSSPTSVSASLPDSTTA